MWLQNLLCWNLMQRNYSAICGEEICSVDMQYGFFFFLSSDSLKLILFLPEIVYDHSRPRKRLTWEFYDFLNLNNQHLSIIIKFMLKGELIQQKALQEKKLWTWEKPSVNISCWESKLKRPKTRSQIHLKVVLVVRAVAGTNSCNTQDGSGLPLRLKSFPPRWVIRWLPASRRRKEWKHGLRKCIHEGQNQSQFITTCLHSDKHVIRRDHKPWNRSISSIIQEIAFLASQEAQHYSLYKWKCIYS